MDYRNIIERFAQHCTAKHYQGPHPQQTLNHDRFCKCSFIY